MKQRFSYVFLSLVVSIILSSCKDCPCIRADLYFSLIGFTESEVDTIILRRFDKNTNFSIQKDTFPFLNTGFIRRNDTLLFSYFPESAHLKSDFDYELFFPEAGKIIRISDITEIISEQRCNGPLAREKVDCVNEITSYKLNGQITQPLPIRNIYLHR